MRATVRPSVQCSVLPSTSLSCCELIQIGEVNGNGETLNGGEPEKGEANDEKTRIPRHDDPEEEGISAVECGRRCWKQYLRRDDSLVTDLFLGQFRKVISKEFIFRCSITMCSL